MKVDQEPTQTRSESMTMAQMLLIARRIQRGESVADEERRAYEVANEALKAAMTELQLQYAEQVQQLRPFISKLRTDFQGLGALVKSVSERFAPIIADMTSRFHDMPPRVQAALLALGESGWYLDSEMGMSELWELERLLQNGEIQKVNEILSSHFENRLPAIEAKLCIELPGREKILRAAIGAHRRCEFELSVPVLLAQVDGACFDITGYLFFTKLNGKPEIARHVGTVETPFEAAFLSPLVSILPINASSRDRQHRMESQGATSWRDLNRHLVLHGESVDYGTLENSLKAISLLNYVASFLKDIQRTAQNAHIDESSTGSQDRPVTAPESHQPSGV